jgi:hypothetical protein
LPNRLDFVSVAPNPPVYAVVGPPNSPTAGVPKLEAGFYPN